MTECNEGSTFSGSVDKLRSEFDSLIEKAMSQGEKALNVFGVKENFFTWSPAVDVREDFETIYVDVDVPGFEANELDVTLAGNMLSVEGNRESVEMGDGVISHLNERKQCSFKRTIPMPSAVNAEDIKADISNGVLHLTIGKSEAAKPKQIVIETAPKPSKEKSEENTCQSVPE